MSERTIAPVMRTVTVDCSPEHAFHIFTERTGAWWPLETHSIAVDQERGVKAESVVVEGREGGRIYEVMSDGTEASWGEVLAWEPPRRVVLAWKPNERPAPPTEIEVRFTPQDDKTRVDLEHRGWERLGEVAEQARAGYASESGWVTVLGMYAKVASGEEAA